MEGLINFVTGIKAVCELALSDTEDGTAAEVHRSCAYIHMPTDTSLDVFRWRA